MKIIIMLILTLSLLLTSCQDGLPVVSAENLYLWKSTQDENVSFFMSIGGEWYTNKFDSSTQSLTQYIDEAGEKFSYFIGVFADYPSINIIKKSGYNSRHGYDKYSGSLDIELKATEENPLFDDLVIDKSKIEYYPISVTSPATATGKKTDKLYFRQDWVSDTIDVLVINIASGKTVFLRSFEPYPEYVYIPERESDGSLVSK